MKNSRKKVAILQSNYIPWKGYFDLIASVDEFIIYDDMQYTRRDWRNRNRIKTPQGLQWLTVPVQVKGKYEQKINETIIDGQDWRSKHWKALVQNYSRAEHFKKVANLIEPFYFEEECTTLTRLNISLLKTVCEYLEISTHFTESSDYRLLDGKTERLINLCAQVGGKEYISGPAAKEYIDERFFQESEIKLTWFDYSGYPEYPQLWGEFVHGVTILDLLFNCGKESKRYMRRL